MVPIFDPFNDRLARDIRNALSSALIETLPALSKVEELAASFLATEDLADHHRLYIQERLLRYQKVAALVKRYNLTGSVCPALAMWDSQLFFEVHECLEGEWYPAPPGERKKALQALICAAGTFVHLAHGNMKGGTKMAARGRQGLQTFGHALPELGPALETLIISLEQPHTPPSLFAKSQCQP